MLHVGHNFPGTTMPLGIFCSFLPEKGSVYIPQSYPGPSILLLFYPGQMVTCPLLPTKLSNLHTHQFPTVELRPRVSPISDLQAPQAAPWVQLLHRHPMEERERGCLRTNFEVWIPRGHLPALHSRILSALLGHMLICQHCSHRRGPCPHSGVSRVQLQGNREAWTQALLASYIHSCGKSS